MGRKATVEELIETALDELGPWPWPEAPRPLPGVWIERIPWLDLPERVDRARMRAGLVALVADVRSRLDGAARQERPDAPLGRFEAIEKAARGLAKKLSALRAEERRMLIGGPLAHDFTDERDAHPDLPGPREWERLRKVVQPKLPGWLPGRAPDWAMPGLVADLLDLADYVRARTVAFQDAMPELKDAGGARKLSDAIQGTPRWRIASAVRLMLERRPKAGGKAPNAAVIGQMLLEAATGQPTGPDGVRTALREVRRVWQLFQERQAELERLTPPPRPIPREEVLASIEARKERIARDERVPPATGWAALWKEVEALATRLERGPPLPRARRMQPPRKTSG